MRKSLLIMAIAILSSCMSMTSEEREIKEWLNGKLTENAGEVSNVEIVGTDSVLSLAIMGITYNECLRKGLLAATEDSSFQRLTDYYVDAIDARNHDGMKKPAELAARHQQDWRLVYKLKVIDKEGKLHDNIEVIIDTDGHPYLTGREYDADLKLWSVRISDIPD